MCLVLDSVALLTPVHGGHWNGRAANELSEGFVYDMYPDNVYIADLAPGPCSADGCGDDGDGGIVVAPLSKGDNSEFTAEIAVDSMDACQALIEMFNAQLADSTSSLMSCDGGGLSPCWELDPDQTVTTHCIDTADSGR